METLCDAEVEKMWEKRVQQWKMQKMARQKLFEQVLEARREQIQQKRMYYQGSSVGLLSTSYSFVCPSWSPFVCSYLKLYV